ncbi:hypothetical protein [Streptomyces sp. Wh19]|uniref:Uncharacterized protein n=1 Tax=Streptomyces sanglieri TaxID=193460 RepID=A0ABW2WRS5_9ACTN|nr:hypothetical protein [Streptomyces sp. Wh19]
MATSTCHVRKTSLGLRRKYRISADDGNGRLLGAAQQLVPQ